MNKFFYTLVAALMSVATLSSCDSSIIDNEVIDDNTTRAYTIDDVETMDDYCAYHMEIFDFVIALGNPDEYSKDFLYGDRETNTICGYTISGNYSHYGFTSKPICYAVFNGDYSNPIKAMPNTTCDIDIPFEGYDSVVLYWQSGDKIAVKMTFDTSYISATKFRDTWLSADGNVLEITANDYNNPVFTYNGTECETRIFSKQSNSDGDWGLQLKDISPKDMPLQVWVNNTLYDVTYNETTDMLTLTNGNNTMTFTRKVDNPYASYVGIWDDVDGYIFHMENLADGNNTFEITNRAANHVGEGKIENNTLTVDIKDEGVTTWDMTMTTDKKGNPQIKCTNSSGSSFFLTQHVTRNLPESVIKTWIGYDGLTRQVYRKDDETAQFVIKYIKNGVEYDRGTGYIFMSTDTKARIEETYSDGSTQTWFCSIDYVTDTTMHWYYSKKSLDLTTKITTTKVTPVYSGNSNSGDSCD